MGAARGVALAGTPTVATKGTRSPLEASGLPETSTGIEAPLELPLSTLSVAVALTVAPVESVRLATLSMCAPAVGKMVAAICSERRAQALPRRERDAELPPVQARSR